MPKADATGLAPEKSATRTLRRFYPCRRVLCLSIRLGVSSYFFGGVSERRPWALKRDDRPSGRSKFFAFCWAEYRSCLHGKVSYPTRWQLSPPPPAASCETRRITT